MTEPEPYDYRALAAAADDDGIEWIGPALADASSATVAVINGAVVVLVQDGRGGCAAVRLGRHDATDLAADIEGAAAEAEIEPETGGGWSA